MCVDRAIRLTDDGPVIDCAQCAQCELCSRDCPTGTLVVNERGFRVIAGGGSGRQPTLAVMVENFASKERVEQILRNAIGKVRKTRPGETLKTIIRREGVEVLR